MSRRADVRREWWSNGYMYGLPPAAPHRRGPGCGATPYTSGLLGWPGLVCTRLDGHTGRHAASGVAKVLAVWERSANDECPRAAR